MNIHFPRPVLLVWAALTLAPWPASLTVWAANVNGEQAARNTEEAARPYDKQQVQRQLDTLANVELKHGLLTGFSLAVVDDQALILTSGYGLADETTQRPAKRDTIYRVGSISKLFTALACMQLVDQDKVDLDVPVDRYLPEFRIEVPFLDAQPITLRMLMCHRSGMIRESPVGSYFDGKGPTMEQTVASIAPCALVNVPGTKYRYSNVGPTIVGLVVARMAGDDFEAYQQDRLLGPLGMTSSTFLVGNVDRSRLATGYMRVAGSDGSFRRVAAPLFELGTLPAGNLYSSAEDLARFASALIADRNGNGEQIISSKSLTEMWRPQLTDASDAFGLGFYVGTHRGHRRVSHTGAVYGHSSVLYILPEKRIAAIVLANEDISSGPCRHLASEALDVMLAAKFGQPRKVPKHVSRLDAAQRAAYPGTYLSQSYWAEVELVDDQVALNISGQFGTLVFQGQDQFHANGRYYDNAPVVFKRGEQGDVDSFTALDQTFTRIDPAKIVTGPKAWRGLLGSYGPPYIPLIITEKHGCLFAMTENMMDYRLTPQNRIVFNMPPGLYTDEELVFQTDTDGRAHSAILANMLLERIE